VRDILCAFVLTVLQESVKRVNKWGFLKQSFKIYFSSFGPHSDDDGKSDAVTYTDESSPSWLEARLRLYGCRLCLYIGGRYVKTA
jgi:hypothetical protein